MRDTEGDLKSLENNLLRDYREVFGMEGNRTPAQKRVLADLESRGRIWRNIWIPSPDMELSPHRAAIAEGERIFAIRIIQMANSKPGTEPKKPTVKKDKK
jgi:hypothetical protein